MPEIYAFTREQLIAMLDEFSEFWETEWLNPDKQLADDDCEAGEYFLRRKMLDPVWPDRTPEVR